MSLRTRRSQPLLGQTALLVSSGVLSAWTMVAADSCARTGWPYLPVRRHVLGALGLYAAVGALLGLLATLLIGLERRVTGLRLGRLGGSWLSPLFYGVMGAAASTSTAFWTFSGEQVSRTRLALFGPLLFMLACGSACAFGCWLILFALRAQRAGRPLWLWAVALGFAALGALTTWADLTLFVSLYSRIHTILELCAALLFGAAFALALHAWRTRARRVGAVLCGFAGAAALWLGVVLAVSQVRAAIDGALAPVWLEEVYIGRVLRRVQIAEAFFKNPFHFPGLNVSRIERLRERYDLGAPTLAPRWDEPLREPEPFRSQIDSLRGARRGYNVIVYYVDTLRNDVASDSALMPNLARFAAGALNFTHAYAAGSDTLRSLPALTSGNYDVLGSSPNDLLKVARRAGYDSTLIIAKSAHHFLGTLRPAFHFDHSIEIQDYPAEQEVWGYGAQQPTARTLVDRAVDFLKGHTKSRRPFLLWLFNFDQHNWRELESDYVDAAAREHRVTDDPDKLPWRYRAVAAAIDTQFGRLQRELARRGLLDNTLVLFVSDHGEALGRAGFWVHSVFLWEPLVRVPLLLKVPGLGPRRVDDRVSLVDVAPTLVRYMQDEPEMSGYQGADLLGYLLPDRPPRRLPLLLIGASKDVLVRVGLVEPDRPLKLVVSLEAAIPELYDLDAADPDAANVADAHPVATLHALKALYQSPVFPRGADDFELRDTREQRALGASGGAP